MTIVIVRTKSQLGWLNLPHLSMLPPLVTAKSRSRLSKITLMKRLH